MDIGWADQTLRRIGQGASDKDVSLMEGALALAKRALPEVDPAPYRQHFEHLLAVTEEALRAQTGPLDDVVARRDALYTALITQARYRGDSLTYNDLDNANLFRVIDRRRGLPVALGVLYIAVGQGLGWDLVGLNFPGHFLLRLDHAGQRSILDPFDDLRRLEAPDLRNLLKRVAGPEAELEAVHYTAVGTRDLLLRLENNRKLRLMAQGRLDLAIAALEGMLMLSPQDPELWRDAGVLHAQVGNLRGAVVALEHALDLGRNNATRQAAEDLLQQIRMRLN